MAQKSSPDRCRLTKTQPRRAHLELSADKLEVDVPAGTRNAVSRRGLLTHPLRGGRYLLSHQSRQAPPLFYIASVAEPTFDPTGFSWDQAPGPFPISLCRIGPTEKAEP